MDFYDSYIIIVKFSDSFYAEKLNHFFLICVAPLAFLKKFNLRLLCMIKSVLSFKDSECVIHFITTCLKYCNTLNAGISQASLPTGTLGPYWLPLTVT